MRPFDFRLSPSDAVHVEAFAQGPDSARVASLFLPDFPAYSGRFEDIAKVMGSYLRLDAHVLHYRGLGKSQGLFSLAGAVSDTTDLVRGLESRGSSTIILVAHSMGAAITLQALREWLTTRTAAAAPTSLVLILLSPMTELPPAERAERDYADFARYESMQGRSYSVTGLVDDFERFRELYRPAEIANELHAAGVAMLVVQAAEDGKATSAQTKAWLASLSFRPDSVELKDDHWFRPCWDMVRSKPPRDTMHAVG